MSGLIVTLELSALAWLPAVVPGIVSGALRTVKFRPLRALATLAAPPPERVTIRRH